MAVTRVHYQIDARRTALVSVDFQVGFGEAAWEPVPHAAAAVENFRTAAKLWRAAGGTVMHVQTYYTAEARPAGRMEDFAPDIAEALAEGAPAAAAYPDLVLPGDVLIRKLCFSATCSSDLLERLRAGGYDTAVVGGLTTPICVQTTVDGLSMAGIKTVVLADACASQAIGSLSAEAAHDAAIERMGYVFAGIGTAAGFARRVAELDVRVA